MKISYKWLLDYIDTPRPVEDIAEILTAIGLEVESIDKIESIPGGLKGVVVGEVLSCVKHPDADRLKITNVNIGAGESLQIVCGAANVAEGQKVLVATIGTTLHPQGGEPLTIKKGKIRGQESHGMICAEDELGLGSGHEGILVLDSAAIPGTSAAELLQISEDYCIEIGLTPNRTDAFSHYGVARDLSAALRNMEGIQREEATLRLPSIEDFNDESKNSTITIRVEDPEACQRYCGITLSNITVGPSPAWLQERLAVIGLRPVNNVVDITNYVQHECGQPLHAFDAAAIDGGIVVRHATEGEKFITLDGVERTMSPDDLMISDEKSALCIAGVFGGLKSGVSEKTTSVFLESAYFNAVSIRKTSKRHALKTDASFRFERGTDPTLAPWALKRAVLLMCEHCGAEISGSFTDFYPTEKKPASVNYEWEKATSLIGKSITHDKVRSILVDLDIDIISETNDAMQLAIPLYRTDVSRQADVVEEVLRIYGFNNIEIPSVMRSSLPAAASPDVERLKERVADLLTSNGCNEIMSMSLTRTKYAAPVNDGGGTAVEILNPLSSDLGMMRQTLLYGALEAIALNQNHKNPDTKLYEFGKVFYRHEKEYSEEKKLGIFLSGRRFPESWNTANGEVGMSDLRKSFEDIVALLKIKNCEYLPAKHELFDEVLEVKAGKKLLARLGSVASTVRRDLDVKNAVWFADVNWDNVIESLPAGRTQYRETDKFPAVRRDLSLLIDEAVLYADLEKTAMETERRLLRKVNLFDVYEGKNLEAGKKSYALSFTLQDSGKTMTDIQVDGIMKKILKALEERHGASLRA